ncbi:hypothetical protein JKF63_04405 [Porcisia hertigi]|uniref:SUI1 domain-containing protein n=1 Tax=Porcisia hertigi TaxID=2761500 RepID=A0A836IVX2_9TRYP|nr:hypothetical protein JKF63_04405 [Porcisia hertigi]
MFKKKYTSKEGQSVGKSDLKSLRADVMIVIGKDNADKFDLIIGKKDTVTKRKYQCGPGSLAFVYFVNGVPFFISIDRLAGDDQDVITPASRLRFPMVPTVFFFLRLHQVVLENGGDWTSVVNECGVATVCHGPTSRYLLGGAHLMMPGILSTQKKTSLVIGDVALIYSLGVDVPYAVGIVTNNMAVKQDTGVGVFVVQCFRDNLWQEFENQFLTNYSLCSHTPLIPPEFEEEEVHERVSRVSASMTENPSPDCDLLNSEAAEGKEVSVIDYSEFFSDEEKTLRFCLCEAVKQVTRTLLPMPMPQFTSIVLHSYPRDGAHRTAIQFKNTKYKKALSFFQSFPDLLTVSETSPGVHCIAEIKKSAVLMRQHNALYADFLSTVHRERCEEEGRALQARLVADGAAVFRQHILSASIFYAAPRRLDDDLIRVLLMGDELSIPRDALFPSIEQVTSGTAPVFERTPVDDNILDEPYSRLTLVDNLKNYIKHHGLLIVSEAQDRKLPTVKIDDTLSKMFSSKTYAPELPLDLVVEGMLGLFRLKHEIVLQTVVEGSMLASDHLIPKHIVKNGPLPKVSVWSEKSANNKVITIVQNLESFGFDLELFANLWKKQFSTSTCVVDPSKEMKNLKPGTRIPLQIHLQGSFQVQITAALVKDANIPQSQLSSRKG